MLRLCTALPFYDGFANVDVWTSQNLQMLKLGVVAPMYVAELFGVESLWSRQYVPLGVHKPWAYLPAETMAELRARCPEIDEIEPRGDT
jgi:hypothetical protein